MKTESSPLDQNKIPPQVGLEDSNAGNKGRSAVLIHVMALLIMLLVLAYGFLGGFLTRDGLTLVGVMGSAGGIGWLWSLVLSVQAIRKKAWRVMGFWVLYAALVEVSVLLLVMWFLEYWAWDIWGVFTTTKRIFDAIFYVALPVLLSVLSFALGLYCFLNRKIRMGEALVAIDPNAKTDAKTLYQMKRSLLIVVMFLILVFPFSLFFFCLTNHGSHRIPDWRIEIVRVAPRWLGTGLDLVMPDGISIFTNSRETLLREGNMTRTNLLKHLKAANQKWAVLAFGNLLRRSDDAALPWLKSVLSGRTPGNISMAYSCLAKNGSKGDISMMLLFEVSQMRPKFPELIQALVWYDRMEMRKQILTAIRDFGPNEGLMAHSIGSVEHWFFTEAQLESIWEHYFSQVSPDSPFAHLDWHLINTPPKAFNRLIRSRLSNSNATMRRECLDGLLNSIDYFKQTGIKATLDNLELHRSFLVSQDDVERRLAANCWMTLLEKSFDGVRKAGANPNGTFISLPFNAEEEKVFQRLHKLAGQFIERRKKNVLLQDRQKEYP